VATKFDFDSLAGVVASSLLAVSADSTAELELEFELVDGSAPQPKTVSNESTATKFRVNFKCVRITKSD
jgi:hypothetical protein